ncbi:hypothetical protein C8J56DRAFT_960591 [Mycena floridula]|nr:hypothetical protein C8J56DRAFT_960591 [Mycena floridula]
MLQNLRVDYSSIDPLPWTLTRTHAQVWISRILRAIQSSMSLRLSHISARLLSDGRSRTQSQITHQRSMLRSLIVLHQSLHLLSPSDNNSFENTLMISQPVFWSWKVWCPSFMMHKLRFREFRSSLIGHWDYQTLHLHPMEKCSCQLIPLEGLGFGHLYSYEEVFL